MWYWSSAVCSGFQILIQSRLDFTIPSVSSKNIVNSSHIVKLSTVYIIIKLESVSRKSIVKSRIIVM